MSKLIDSNNVWKLIDKTIAKIQNNNYVAEQKWFDELWKDFVDLPDESFKTNYHYFVSYSHNHGFGNIILLLKKPIDTSDVVNEIKDYIERNSHVSDVVILNWQRLKN